MSLATETERACACGTILSQSNASPECYICTRLRMDAELLNDLRARQLLVVRKTLAVYRNPERCLSADQYRHELGVALDELCIAMSLPILEAEVPW